LSTGKKKFLSMHSKKKEFLSMHGKKKNFERAR
jgi:hypothetical protein